MAAEAVPAYAGDIAEVYDELYADADDQGAVAVLAAIAQGGPILELGIGTGRLAVPLAELGFEVAGVEVAGAFIERLRAKPAGSSIRVMEAALPEIPAPPGSYRLTYAAASTLFDLSGCGAQQRLIFAVADVLEPTGRFVVEAFVPAEHHVVRGDPAPAGRQSLHAVHNPEALHIEACEVVASSVGEVVDRFDLHYLSPTSIDNLAGNAGLELEWRWADWRRSPFRPGCRQHVSCYRKPG